MVVLLLALSALPGPASASLPPFHRSFWSAISTKDATGCSSGTNQKAHWSKTTGLGSMYVTARAKTCRGLASVYGSSITLGSQLQVSVPVHFGVHSSGVNVTWSIAALLTTAGGVIGSANCTPTRSNTSYNLGYTWENYTSISYTCYGLGSVSIGGATWLDDLTTGTQYESNNSWTGVSNFSGTENYSFADQYRYSNATYWSYNTSASYSFNHSYGPIGLLVGRWNPSWFVNGTFVPTDRFLLVTSIAITVYDEAFGYAKSYGSGIGDLQNGPDQVDLTSVVVH